MAEMRYDENKENLRLPKNVRQIGKTQGQTKIYVEDYVITFINQLTESSPMEPKLAILLGLILTETFYGEIRDVLGLPLHRGLQGFRLCPGHGLEFQCGFFSQ